MSDREAGFLGMSGWWIRRVLPWAAAAVASIGATLLVMLPVAWLAPVLAYASHEQLELAGPEGSL
jgi:general secretion pathway protein N